MLKSFFLNSIFILIPIFSGNYSLAEDGLPSDVLNLGYRVNTFFSEIKETEIDIHTEKSPVWFSKGFFDGCQPSSTAFSWTDAIFSINGSDAECSKGGSVSLATVSADNKTNKWSGLAFGGGAYFQAEIRFNPLQTINAKNNIQWPAFWAMSLEHLAGMEEEKWVGEQTGFVRFSEIDIMEYITWPFAGEASYGASVHDWFGIYGKTCGVKKYCRISNNNESHEKFGNFVIRVPHGFNFNEFHRYGALWSPASKDKKGSIRFYLDGIPQRSYVEWDYYSGEPYLPGPQPWSFGIVDQHHMVLIVSTSRNQPVQVRKIEVWQSDDSKNIRK